MKLGLSKKADMKLGLGMTENEVNLGLVEERNILELREKKVAPTHNFCEMYEVAGETIEHLRYSSGRKWRIPTLEPQHHMFLSPKSMEFSSIAVIAVAGRKLRTGPPARYSPSDYDPPNLN